MRAVDAPTEAPGARRPAPARRRAAARAGAAGRHQRSRAVGARDRLRPPRGDRGRRDGGDATLAARELFDVRSLDEAGVTPLFDALDARGAAHVDAVRAVPGAAGGKVAALRRLTAAYQQLSSTIAGLVVESVAPSAEALREAARRHRRAARAGRARTSAGRRARAQVRDDHRRRAAGRMRFDLGLDPAPSRPRGQARAAALAGAGVRQGDRCDDRARRAGRDAARRDPRRRRRRQRGRAGGGDLRRDRAVAVGRARHRARPRPDAARRGRAGWPGATPSRRSSTTPIWCSPAWPGPRSARCAIPTRRCWCSRPPPTSCARPRASSLAAVGRATRDRAAALREELAQRRLREALDEQTRNLRRLRDEVAQNDFE
jgi:hypothetical protein